LLAPENTPERVLKVLGKVDEFNRRGIIEGEIKLFNKIDVQKGVEEYIKSLAPTGVLHEANALIQAIRSEQITSVQIKRLLTNPLNRGLTIAHPFKKEEWAIVEAFVLMLSSDEGRYRKHIDPFEDVQFSTLVLEVNGESPLNAIPAHIAAAKNIPILDLMDLRKRLR
jgi:hypothetical protein